MTTWFVEGIADSQPAGPAPGSLFEATARLEGVIAAVRVIEPWCEQLKSTLRDCTAAVQYHLDALEGDDGMKEHIIREEPRLLSRIEALDETLNELRAQLVEAGQSPATSTNTLIEPLARLVTELRDAAIGEVEILHEALISTGSGD